MPSLPREITVTPNAQRGYDATVYDVRAARESAFMRNLRANSGDTSPARERDPVHTVNAPSESAARTAAQAWSDANPAKRARRALSEGELESREAARNERDYE